MARLAQEAAPLAHWPTAQRLLGLKRILPKKAVQQVLQQTGHDRRLCSRWPAWFMVWFVVVVHGPGAVRAGGQSRVFALVEGLLFGLSALVLARYLPCRCLALAPCLFSGLPGRVRPYA